MIHTAVGLPNTCCVCGKPQKAKWYAENEDEARSGLGTCKKDSVYLPSHPKAKGPVNTPKEEPVSPSDSPEDEPTPSSELKEDKS